MGFLGYARTGSLPSLYGGVGLGACLALSAIAAFFGKTGGGYAAVFFTLVSTALFSWRFSVSGKPFAAFFAALSGCMLLFLLAQMPKWRRR